MSLAPKYEMAGEMGESNVSMIPVPVLIKTSSASHEFGV